MSLDMKINIEWTVEEALTYSATLDVTEVFGEAEAARMQEALDAGGDARQIVKDLIEDGKVPDDYLAGMEGDGATEERLVCNSRVIDHWELKR